MINNNNKTKERMAVEVKEDGRGRDGIRTYALTLRCKPEGLLSGQKTMKGQSMKEKYNAFRRMARRYARAVSQPHASPNDLVWAMNLGYAPAHAVNRKGW